MAREMKDSGIEWIGEIPKDWEYVKLKCFYEFEKGKNAAQYTQDYIGLHNGNHPVYSGQTENNGIMGEIDTFDYDITECLFTTTVGAKAMTPKILGGKFSLSQNCLIMRQIKECNNKFFYYILFSLFDYEKLLIPTYMQPSLRVDDLNKYAFFIPIESEQQKVANFLDKKCTEIESLSSDIKSQINILEDYKKSVITEAVTKGLNPDAKMKESRIAWVNTAPTHWTMSKIKYEIVPLQRAVRSDDLVMTCFRDGEVTLRQNRREDGFTISFTENGYQGVEVGDLVIHGMDAFAGAIGCSDSRGKITPVVHVCKTTGNNRFFMYMLRSMAMNDVFMNYAEGIRVRSSDFRNFNKLGKFPIVVPPINEQNEIVAHLDNECEKIDAIIAQKKEQLLVMVDYKKSMIYEYVTGKREVPDNNG